MFLRGFKIYTMFEKPQHLYIRTRDFRCGCHQVEADIKIGAAFEPHFNAALAPVPTKQPLPAQAMAILPILFVGFPLTSHVLISSTNKPSPGARTIRAASGKTAAMGL